MPDCKAMVASCLLAGVFALPCVAAPAPKTSASSSSGSFCLTPSLFSPIGKWHLAPLRPTRLHLSGPAYELTCASAAWQNNGAQASLESDIVLTTPTARSVIFCNQAFYNPAAGTIDLQGSVRVTTYFVGTAQPKVSIGDGGTVTLGPGAPQISLRSDPPEPPKHRRG